MTDDAAPALVLKTSFTVADIGAIARNRRCIEISGAVESRILAARAVVDRHTALELPVYGLTTGLGASVDTRLATDDLVAFQLRVPQARAVGVGPALATDSVRAMMAARISGMAAGGSGVRSPGHRQSAIAVTRARRARCSRPRTVGSVSSRTSATSA